MKGEKKTKNAMSKRYEFKFTDEQRKEMSEIFMKEFMKRMKIDAYNGIWDFNGSMFMNKSSTSNIYEGHPKFI